MGHPDQVRFTFTHMTGSKAGQTETLDAPVITVGRGDGNLLRYDPHQDDKVSGFHARLEERGGQVFLVDLDSTNGTFVNGNRIQGTVPLVSGAVVTFGEDGGPNVAIQFAAGGAIPAAAGATAPPPATAGPSPGMAKTAPVPVPAGGGAPPPAQKPAGGGAGKKLLAGGILGTIGMFLLGCVLFAVVVAVNKKVRATLPPWAVRIVKKIPGVNKLMKPPRAPKLPGGIRTPRPRLPAGGSSGSTSETPSESPDEAPEDEAPDDAAADPPAEEEAPADEASE
jgi:hypothetical protein